MIEGCIEQLERDRFFVDHVLMPPKHEEWLRRDVSIKRASGTTSIEKLGMSEAEVDELLRRRTTAKPDEAQRANLNAIQAYEFIDYLSDQTDLDVDELAIRQLNREFLRGESEAITPGIYRRGQNKINEYLPPNQGDVPGLMREFALWLRADDELHPLVKAGIAHIQIVAIHPFWDGNGRTARGLATLTLQRSPMNFKKLLSLERFLASVRDRYITAIETALGTRYTEGYDATSWLEFFATSVVASASALTNEMTDWHRMMTDLHKLMSQHGLNARQTDGLAFAAHSGKITRSDYMEIARVSPSTATRDLEFLVSLGLLDVEGKTRNRIYKYSRTVRRSRDEVPPNQIPLPEANH